MHQRLIRITYEDQHGAITDRDVEAKYLDYKLPIWYALAWDRLRDDVRSFLIDRIRKLQSPPAARLRRADAFLTAGDDDARSVSQPV